MKRQRNGMSEKKYYDGWYSYQIGANSEYKAWKQITPTDSSAGSGTTLLFAPEQGNKSYERTGRKVFLSDIKMRGKIFWNTDDTALTNTIQSITFALVLDKAVDKQSGAWDPDVFQKQWGDLNAVPADIAADVFQNTEEFGRYQILDRKTYVRPPRVTADTTWNSISFSKVKLKHKFIKPRTVNYGMKAEGDQANVTDNGVRLIVIADGNDPTYISDVNNNPIFRCAFRVGFFDHKTRVNTMVRGGGGGRPAMVWMPRGGPLRRANPWRR